jgi:hypothetical protein
MLAEYGFRWIKITSGRVGIDALPINMTVMGSAALTHPTAC